MILKNAKLYGQEGIWDIDVQDGYIQTIKPAADTATSVI